MYAFSDAEGAAAWAMLDVEPTSVTGVGALLTYVAAVSASGSCIITEYENEESLYGDALIRWAADNLERLAGGSNV